MSVVKCVDCFYKLKRKDLDYCAVYDCYLELIDISAKINCEYYEKYDIKGFNK